MARLHFFSGSIALIALTGVNAEPCRPSSSVVTTTTALVASDTTTAMTTETATTNADAIATTVAATTIAAPAEACHGLPIQYTAPQGTTFDIECERRLTGGVRLLSQEDASDFKTCVDICDGNQECLGAAWIQDSAGCYLISSFDGTTAAAGNDFAKARSRST